MTDPHYTPSPAPEAGTDEAMYLQAAANTVARLAPDPGDLDTDEQADYDSRAEVAEFIVYKWYLRTQGGAISSQGRSGLSASYVSWASVKDAIRGAMGPYFSKGRFRTVEIERA